MSEIPTTHQTETSDFVKRSIEVNKMIISAGRASTSAEVPSIARNSSERIPFGNVEATRGMSGYN